MCCQGVSYNSYCQQYSHVSAKPRSSMASLRTYPANWDFVDRHRQKSWLGGDNSQRPPFIYPRANVLLLWLLNVLGKLSVVKWIPIFYSSVFLWVGRSIPMIPNLCRSRAKRSMCSVRRFIEGRLQLIENTGP